MYVVHVRSRVAVRHSATLGTTGSAPVGYDNEMFILVCANAVQLRRLSMNRT